MVGFGVLVAALLVGGTGVAWTLWKRFDRDAADITAVELWTAGMVIGSAFWIGACWILALTHTFTARALWIVAAVAVAGASVVLLRASRLLHHELPRNAASKLLLLAPVGLWTIFALWRGAILPPASHDALSYHLPRALMMVRAGGFEYFPAADHRINAFPANYELVLASVISMSGTDRLTEWVSTAMFAAFLLAAAALATRWWPNKPAVPEVILAVAATPILLLHSSADKNDLMASVFALTAILWGARWYARGGVLPMTLLVTSLVLSGGTKPQAAGVFLAVVPFLLIRGFREWRARRLSVRHVAATGAFSLGFFAIGGAAPYVMLLHRARGAAPGPPGGWGDFSNLWEVPILLLLAPFSRSIHGVWVPWRSEYWFWPRYEIFFSNWGIVFSLLLLLLPLGVVMSHRERGESATERVAGSAIALLAAAVLLPVEVRPVGFFSAMGRYLLFIVPVGICWVVPPLMTSLQRSKLTRLSGIVATTLSIVFVLQASDLAVNDRFAPLEYLRYASSLPGTRLIWFEANRAASVVDRMAGPDDTVAIAGSFDTWIHPAYGAGLTRPVILLPHDATGRDIPDSARWVIVDRSWNVTWGHPELTDTGKFWRYIGRGAPTEEDLRVYRALMRDPRFRLVYRNVRLNQAVFWRIEPNAGRRAPVPRLDSR